MRMPRPLAELPVRLRYLVIGALAAGIPGCIAGLAIGLRVYAPTAWFATFELGIPSALAGAVLGMVTGSVVVAVQKARSDRPVR